MIRSCSDLRCWSVVADSDEITCMDDELAGNS